MLRRVAGSIWFRLLVTAILFALLILFVVDLRQAAAYLVQMRPRFLLLLLIILAADRVLMAYKWALLVRCRGMALSNWEAVRTYFVATFAGVFLPTTVGGDAIRVGISAGSGRSSEALAASVVIERVLGLVASALIALAGLLLLGYLVSGLPPVFLYWALGLLVLLLLALLFSLSGISGRLIGSLASRLEGGGALAAWLGKFLAAYYEYRHHRATLLAVFALSLLKQTSPIVVNWLAARALGVEMSLLASAAATPPAIALARLPISVSQFGVVEVMFVFFFSLLGVDKTGAALVGSITNLAVVAVSLPGLIFYLTGGVRSK